MKQEIMNKIQEQYNKLCQEYEENQILWVAAIGPKIFNLNSEIDINIAACILPTEEELYNTYPNIVLNTSYFKVENNIFDIRLLTYAITNKIPTCTEMILSPYKIINPKYEELLNKKLFINKELLYLSDNDNILKELQKNIKTIIQSSFELPSQEQELINILTKTEIKVLKNIIDDFKGEKEGDIKVSNATNVYKVSTVVFRTLFYKLKDYRVAEIDSRGVKGTHIKFNNIKKLKALINE